MDNQLATNFTDLHMPDAVTVLVSTELLAELTDDWSPPVQIRIRRTPGIGSGYDMTARTHTCCTCPTSEDVTAEMRDETGQHLNACPRSEHGRLGG